MAAFKWPRRAHTERRLYPRVRVQFPALVAVSDKAPAVGVDVVDVSMGGVRVTIGQYLELFTRLPIELRVPVLDRDDQATWTVITTTAAVVRVDPDEPGEPGTSYDMSLSFSRLTTEEERALALFLLQRLQIDPDTELRL